MMRNFLLLIALLGLMRVSAQTDSSFSYDSYIDLVRLYHPIIRQADLLPEQADLSLLNARGALDPKISLDQNQKHLSGKDYYDQRSLYFKIPAPLGIDFGLGINDNQGLYLNPESYTSDKSLYSAGVSIPIVRGLLARERDVAIRQSKIYQKMSLLDRQLLINQTIYDASIAYYLWAKYYNEYKLYSQYTDNAYQRLQGIKRSYAEGDKPAIDTTETRIAYETRELQKQKAWMNLQKSRLQLSSYLWDEDQPIELQDYIRPQLDTSILGLSPSLLQTQIDTLTHPKLALFDYKQNSLQLEKTMYRWMLLPEIGIDYKLLSYDPFQISGFDPMDHSAGISLQMPIFQRKQRAKIGQTDLKIQSLQLEKNLTQIQLQNKLQASQIAIASYLQQYQQALQLVQNYQRMLDAEMRKFEVGESSVFMINSRESKLIESQQKIIDLQYDLYQERSSMNLYLGTDMSIE